MKKEYVRPSMEAIVPVTGSLCDLGTGSGGDDSGGLAKKDAIVPWQEAEDDETQEENYKWGHLWND